MGIARDYAPGRGWLAIVSSPTVEAFSRAFVAAPVLEASVLAEPIIGVAALRAFFNASRGMYDRTEFMTEHRAPSRTWLEWQGEYRGLPVAGMTTLVMDPGDAIGRVRLFHMPLAQLTAFAADLHQRLAAAEQGHIPCR